MAKEKPKIAQKPRGKSTHQRDTHRGMRGWERNENPNLHHSDAMLVDGGDMRAVAAESVSAGREPDVRCCGRVGAE